MIFLPVILYYFLVSISIIFTSHCGLFQTKSVPTTICLKSALNKYFERDPVFAPHRKSGNGEVEFADVSLVREDKPNQTKPSGNGESEFADVSLVREDKRGQTILSTGHSSQLDILKPNSAGNTAHITQSHF